MATLTLHFMDRQYLYLKGDLTFETINDKILEGINFKTSQRLTIDLSEVKNSNSAGLALIVEWKKRSKIHQTTLIFTHIPEQLLMLAKLSGLKNL